jgi:hypothetical protein
MWVMEHWISLQRVGDYVDVGCGALDKQARVWILWMWVVEQWISKQGCGLCGCGLWSTG